ncbi:MAG TPA: serine/threonine-protein kinase, partial [Isosphaeraceae bacterium]|nr:serine/threonine-protein kinase [Isosphaeraceae bacterium]
ECPASGREDADVFPEKGKYPAIAGFDFKGELGRGGMGVVYLAWQPKLDRHVALKVMPPAQGAEDRIRKKCYAEAKAFSRLSHANVVGIHDVGEEYPWFYLVLDYMRGGSLKDRLDGPLPPRDAARLAASIAETVDAIHEAGLLHLDLKPANILFAGSRDDPWDTVVPKVSDFGISRVMSQTQSQNTGGGPSLTGLCAGTPSYMAPEQVCGSPKELGRAADIHALGAILYELLTGRPPFQGASTAETMDQVRTQEPVRPTRLNRHIPRDLEVITLKCLEKEPSKRYASAGALAEDLRRWLDGRPIAARPVPLLERGWRWCRRRPVIASLAAALLLGFVALFGLYRRAEDQRVRAEAARNEAEQYLEVVSTVTERLQRLLLDAEYGSLALEGDRWSETAKLVREQIARVRTSSGFGHRLLLPLSQIDGLEAGRLRDLRRLDEARVLARERIELLRLLRDRDPGNENYLWETAEALLRAGMIEKDAWRGKEALHYFDQVSSLLVGNASVHPARGRLALLLSEAYVQLRDEFVRGGKIEQSQSVAAGHLKILALHDSPGLVLSKACRLADQGEWDRARGIVRELSLGKRLVQSEPIWLRLAVEQGLEEWFVREMRHWDKGHEGQKPSPAALDREADSILSLLAHVYEALEIKWPTSGGAIGGMINEPAARAANYRKAGRLDEADRTVGFLMALAQRLVRNFPENPGCYLVLNEAFMQQSKNAWKRGDRLAIKLALGQSINALNRALNLDPGNQEFQQLLQDRKERLAGIP